MHPKWRRRRVPVALFAALTFTACDSAQQFTSPPEATGPSEFEAFEKSVESRAIAAGIDLESAPAELPLSMSSPGDDWVFVQGSAGDEAVEAVVGSRGGVLNLGSHWLLVPSNAVRGSVRFRMAPISDGALHVELTATRIARGAEEENDVGRSGFRKPVYLAFHFGDLESVPVSLQVAWLTEGALLTQQTFIYEEAWAVGVLRHFSGYVLVGN